MKPINIIYILSIGLLISISILLVVLPKVEEPGLEVNIYNVSLDGGFFCEDITVIEDQVYVACVTLTGKVVLYKLDEGPIFISKGYLGSFGTFRTAKFLGNYLIYFNETDHSININFYNIPLKKLDMVEIKKGFSSYTVLPFRDGYLLISGDNSWYIFLGDGLPRVEESRVQVENRFIETEDGIVEYNIDVIEGSIAIDFGYGAIHLNVSSINFIYYFGKGKIILVGSNPDLRIWRIFLLDIYRNSIIDSEVLSYKGLSVVGHSDDAIYIYAVESKGSHLLRYDISMGNLSKIAEFKDFYVSWAYMRNNILITIGGYREGTSSNGERKYTLSIYVDGKLWKEWDLVSSIVLHERIFDNKIYLIIPETTNPDLDSIGSSVDIVELIFKS